jgi:hypothetical protein
MRTAMATAATILALGACGALGYAGAARAADKNLTVVLGSGDLQVLTLIATARAEFSQHDYDAAVEALKPELAPAVFDTLSVGMRYEVVRLYARSLYGLADWTDAHEAFIDLTASSRATRGDWLLRLDTAAKVGDVDDMTLAHDRLQDVVSDDDADPVA